MEISEMVGKRITVGRKQLGLNRERFAELIGVSAYYVGQIERGSRKMSFDTLIKVADCLHISLDYLVKGEAPIQTNDELLQLIGKCSPQEIALFSDMIKVAMPHLGRLNK